MKIIRISKRRIMIFGMLLIMLFVFSISDNSFGMQHYYKLDFSTGLVTASKLNVRSGPSTKYSIVTTVNKNEYVRVFAGVGNWYIIQTDSDYVGAVSKQYIKAIYPNSNSGNTNQGSTSNNNDLATLNVNEQEVLRLINAERVKQGLSELKIDTETQKVARIKAQDMVDNNYFSHNSPIYGSPFDMLKKFKVSYKTAGENIAGNSSNSNAVSAWMNSSRT